MVRRLHTTANVYSVGGNSPAVRMIPNLKFSQAPASVAFTYSLGSIVPASVSVQFGKPTNTFGTGYNGTDLATAAPPASMVYSDPGMYNYSLTVTDAQHNTYSDGGFLLGAPPGEKRGMLCDLFGYLKSRMAASDPAGASLAFNSDVRQRYLTFFNSLGTHLPAMAQNIGYIAEGYFGASLAELMLVRDNSNNTRSGYPMRMSQDADGVWRISGM